MREEKVILALVWSHKVHFKLRQMTHNVSQDSLADIVVMTERIGSWTSPVGH